MYTNSEVKAHASKLRDVLAGMGHQLKHSQCLEAISKVEGYPDWNTHTAALSSNQQRAEQFLDEILEAGAELNSAKFFHRFEEKYLVGFSESEFLKNRRNTHENVGDYVRREFFGCLAAEKLPGDDRFPNQVMYLWRGFFEKGEVLIILDVYRKGETHYVSEIRYR